MQEQWHDLPLVFEVKLRRIDMLQEDIDRSFIESQNNV